MEITKRGHQTSEGFWVDQLGRIVPEDRPWRPSLFRGMVKGEEPYIEGDRVSRVVGSPPNFKCIDGSRSSFKVKFGQAEKNHVKVWLLTLSQQGER